MQKKRALHGLSMGPRRGVGDGEEMGLKLEVEGGEGQWRGVPETLLYDFLERERADVRVHVILDLFDVDADDGSVLLVGNVVCGFGEKGRELLGELGNLFLQSGVFLCKFEGFVLAENLEGMLASKGQGRGWECHVEWWGR